MLIQQAKCLHKAYQIASRKFVAYELDSLASSSSMLRHHLFSSLAELPTMMKNII